MVRTGKPGSKPGQGRDAGGVKPGTAQKRINVDFPLWMVEQLDQESDRMGVSRQALVKFWIAERLDRLSEK